MDGIINVCKPAGISSFKALSVVKYRLAKELGIPFKRFKMGHLGTLDPDACGVLVLLCGRATKLADSLHGGAKIYRSVFAFGLETDTLDATGQITASGGIIPTREQVLFAIKDLVGDIEIEVPKFSAVHIDGVRAYDLARRGVDFVAPKKIVNIKRFELLADTKHLDLHRKTPLEQYEFFVEIECNAGTYVRSLAKLLAQKLGTLAIASTIIRTHVGDFSIENAKGIDDVTLGDIKLL